MNGTVSKIVVGATPPRVRIPPPPLYRYYPPYSDVWLFRNIFGHTRRGNEDYDSCPPFLAKILRDR